MSKKDGYVALEANQLSTWTDELKEWVLNHPTTLRTFVLHFESHLDAAVIPQSLPCSVKGHVIAVLIGKDVTVEEYLSNALFCEEPRELNTL
ncbi:hypothetical protein HDU88_007100 [Geranomyces variabilis]|nr:hypothetical protein HDU88_007100 [Geranomyces variabilis]